VSIKLTTLNLRHCTIHLDRRVAVRDGKTVRLTSRELALLRYLLERPGEVVSNEELLTEVWGYAPTVITRAVSKTLHRLRSKIEVDPGQPDHLQTEHGVGLRLNLSIPIPERQLVVPSEPARRMPTRKDAFVGRCDDLERLGAAIQTSPLVTITGTAGTGKTRLAQQLTQQVASRFSGGVWMVDLSSASTCDESLLHISRSLSISLTHGDPALSIQQTLQRMGDVLLMLDNFEQLEPAAARMVGEWIQHAPKARFLITSRVPLTLAGEVQYPLDVLSIEEALALFEVRAQAVRPSFAITDDNRDTLLALVEQLDRLSLAIELAASRIRILSPVQLLERMTQRFKLLQCHSPDRTARQSSLQRALDGSWSLLQPWEQLALAQCSVFRGGFSLEAAEAILDLSHWPDADDPMEVIFSLVNHSLIRVQDQPGEPPRCQMFNSIRDYAAMMLASPDMSSGPGGVPLTGPHAQEEAQREHSIFYSQLGSEDSVSRIERHDGQAHFLRISGELENLLAAASHSQPDPDRTIFGLCVLACAVVFRRQGPFPTSIQQLSDALNGEVTPRLRGRLLQARSGLSGSPSPSEDLKAAIRIAEGLNDLRWQGVLHTDYAAQLQLMGAPGVNAAMEKALTFSRTAKDEHQQGIILSYIAHRLYMKGENGRARRLLLEALAIHRQVGNQPQEGAAISTLSLLDESEGKYASAIRGLERAVEICEELELTRAEGITQTELGRLQLQQGHLERSLLTLEQALRCHRRVESRFFESITLCSIAHWHALQGDHQEAAIHYQTALKLARACEFQHSEGLILGHFALLQLAQGELGLAAENLTQSIALLEKSQPALAGRMSGGQAIVAARRGDLTAAWQHLSRAEEQIGQQQPYLRGLLLCCRCEVALLAQRPDEATDASREVEAIVQQLELTSRSEMSTALAALRSTAPPEGARF